MRALVITAALLAGVSVVFWQPLATPSRFLATTLPLGAFLAPVALAVIVFVFRRAIGAFLRRATTLIPTPARFIVLPLVATILFAVSWAGSHFGHEGDVGLLPQIAFPAVSGIYAFAVARWGISPARPLAGYLRAKDRVPAKLRVVAVIALPTLVSYYLSRSLGPGQLALTQQLVVLAGLVIGYLMMAPAKSAPSVVAR